MPRTSDMPSSSRDSGSYQVQPNIWDPSAYNLKGVIPPLDDDEYIEDDNGMMGQMDQMDHGGEEEIEDEEELLEMEMGPSSSSAPMNMPTLHSPLNLAPATPQQLQCRRKTSAPFDTRKMLRDFWPDRKRRFESIPDEAFKESVRHMELPMARVKKIMKIDDDVKNQMISQDAPLFLSAVSELFIQEITLKSWLIVEEGRRKTLQKCDVAAAAAREEHFDFLIDIVPREESARKCQAETVIAEQAAGVQYVLADCDSMGSGMYQLDNGQIVQATAIGQPIPIADPSGMDLGQLPIQVIQVPANNL